MRIHSWALVASLTTTSFLSACSPEQNWREVGFEGAALKAQLPCKPDRTTRSVPLGGRADAIAGGRLRKRSCHGRRDDGTPAGRG